jgi:hypothetical protein
MENYKLLVLLQVLVWQHNERLVVLPKELLKDKGLIILSLKNMIKNKSIELICKLMENL